ncbi:MAG: hypothetical protein DDT29_02204 [Dehalococcoidia bacterium]|nr:hypothetical protein [Bacillota bacterium]
MPELVATITDDAYTKVYRLRVTGQEGRTVEISIPKVVVGRAAKKADLSIKEFLKSYRAEWLYDDFDGAFVRFVPVVKEEAWGNQNIRAKEKQAGN